MPLLDAIDLEKHYGEGDARVDALNKVTLEVEEGEYCAIMGPSGCGKSSFLSILGAMSPPSAGRLVVDGVDVYELSQDRRADFRREYLGFVFQQLQLIPYLTALENVALPLVVTEVRDKWGVAREALASMGLGKKADRLPSELSGGEQGRVAIARAIVNKPPILLADEPVGSLDTKTGRSILDLFKRLNDEGQTIVMVTHNPDSLCDVSRVVRIMDGSIVADEKTKPQLDAKL